MTKFTNKAATVPITAVEFTDHGGDPDFGTMIVTFENGDRHEVNIENKAESIESFRRDKKNWTEVAI
jgi:hypothetical protein